MSYGIKSFKKVRSDQRTTTLIHPDGHELTVAHAHLSPKLRGQIESLPHHDMPHNNAQYMDAGGGVQPQEQAPQTPAQEPAPVGTQEEQPNSVFGWIGQQAKTAWDKMGHPTEPFDIIQQKFRTGEISMDQRDKMIRDMELKQGQQMKEAAQAEEQQPETPIEQQAAQQFQQPQGQQGVVPAAATNQDPYGMQNYNENIQKAYGQAATGLGAQYLAEQGLAKAHENIANQAIKKAQDFENHHNQVSQDIDNERAALVNDVKNGHINPDEWWENRSVPGKIGTAIGLIMGGIGGAMLGQENPVLKMVNKHIDDNVAAQKANLGKTQSLLNANRQRFQDETDAVNMTRAMQADQVAQQMQLAAAKSQDPMAQARLMQASSDLLAKYAPILQQTKMRQTMFTGTGKGVVDPAMAVTAIVPQHQQEMALKEVAAKKEVNELLQRSLQGFDHIANMVGRGTFSPNDASSAKETLATEIAKASLGRLNMDAAEEIARGLMPGKTDFSKATVQNKRMRLIQTIKGMPGYKTPTLDAYSIQVPTEGLYSQYGAPRIQLGPIQPVKGP